MRAIDIKTSDGVAKAWLFLPQGAAGATGYSGVMLFMDAFGPRQSLFDMAERIAGVGYAALVPDLFYRFGAYGPFDAKTAFGNEDSGKQIRAMIGATTQAMTEADTAGFIAALDEAGATGPAGVVGYCMGGGRALAVAAAYPDRIAAAASFHGGNLASDRPDSPHLRAAEIRGRVYVGTAAADTSFPPEQSTLFVDAFRKAGVDFTLENYVGVAHGWAVADTTVFHPEGSERHWRRLLGLFEETLVRA